MYYFIPRNLLNKLKKNSLTFKPNMVTKQEILENMKVYVQERSSD